MSITAFAELCEISKSQMAAVLNGNRQPGLHFLYRLALGTNTNLNYLIGLVYPEANDPSYDPDAYFLAQQIAQLSPEQQTIVKNLVLVLALAGAEDDTQDDSDS